MQAPDFEALLLFDREPDALQPEQVCQALAARFGGAEPNEGR